MKCPLGILFGSGMTQKTGRKGKDILGRDAIGFDTRGDIQGILKKVHIKRDKKK